MYKYYTSLPPSIHTYIHIYIHLHRIYEFSTDPTCQVRSRRGLRKRRRKALLEALGGSLSHGGIPIAGWLMSCKIYLQMDDVMSPLLEKPHLGDMEDFM